MTALTSDLTTAVTPPALGSIVGIVALEGGASPANVTLSLENTDIDTQSAASGYFTLTNVPPGTYTLTAYKVGYETAVYENITVDYKNSKRNRPESE